LIARRDERLLLAVERDVVSPRPSCTKTPTTFSGES
jgi:hypothetical protein